MGPIEEYENNGKKYVVTGYSIDSGNWATGETRTMQFHPHGRGFKYRMKFWPPRRDERWKSTSRAGARYISRPRPVP